MTLFTEYFQIHNINNVAYVSLGQYVNNNNAMIGSGSLGLGKKINLKVLHCFQELSMGSSNVCRG